MKLKKIISLLGIILLMVGFVGCGSTKETSTPLKEEKKAIVKEIKKAPLDVLKDEFKKQGFEVGENETVAFEMLGATNGNKYKLNGELIEVYIYEEGKLTTEGKKQFEQVKSGSISMSGINLKVDYINGFALTRLDDHKDKNKIIEVVKNIK